MDSGGQGETGGVEIQRKGVGEKRDVGGKREPGQLARQREGCMGDPTSQQGYQMLPASMADVIILTRAVVDCRHLVTCCFQFCRFLSVSWS